MDSRKMWPSIDHTILSPSGRVSKRSRDAALKREAELLFPPGYWERTNLTDTEIRAEKARSLRRTAANLRELADRGMNRTKYLKEAQKLETEAARIAGGIGGSMYPKRITAVVSPEQLALIEEAAKAQNRSLSSFILDSVLKAVKLYKAGENNDRREGK